MTEGGRKPLYRYMGSAPGAAKGPAWRPSWCSRKGLQEKRRPGRCPASSLAFQLTFTVPSSPKGVLYFTDSQANLHHLHLLGFYLHTSSRLLK
jgi:hypothetical protein